MDEAFFGSQPHVLSDSWARKPIVLNGPVEYVVAPSQGRSLRSFATGLLGLIVAFAAFQFFISPVAMVLLLMAEGVDMGALQGPDAVMQLIETNVREVIIGNSVGQVLGLGVTALLFARLHARAIWRFLRVRRIDVMLLGLALVGLVALTPIVQWLGTINQSLPLPESLRALEQTQMELIEKVLSGGLGVAFNLLMLALVPAVCEELLFRGYAQRQFERGIGIAGGVLCSGIIFGLYHLRFTQALPLSALGLYLAYLTWRTGSLWPAVLVHFANNAFSILVANYVARQPELDPQALETMHVPWYMLIPSVVAFAVVVYLLHRLAETLLAQQRGGPSASSPPRMVPDRDPPM